jgi:hypothetical protein
MAASSKNGFWRRVMMGMATLSGCTFLLLNQTQCEWLVTRFDPCGTIFANCEPGTFQLQFADVPDYGVDPTCTIPGQCTDEDVFESPYADLGPGFEGP